MTNLFAVAASDIPAEDKFTSSLAYLIENIPDIGAEWAAHLAQAGDLETPRFRHAIDHPEGDAESKPDFLLVCEQYDIRCEHKLDSKLGVRQLERYLKLPDGQGRPTHVALITNWDVPDSISEDVRCHPRYLQPRSGSQAYFTWQQLYPVVAKRTERLAQEFAAYMTGLGMAPINMPGNWDGLFSDAEVAASFQAMTKPMKEYFKQLGAVCKGDAGKLGVQIQRPTDWLHLMYVYVSKTSKPYEPGLQAPFIAARIFIYKKDSAQLDRFRGQRVLWETNQGRIVGRPVQEAVSWNKEVELAYEYVSPLSGYLAESESLCRNNLLAFAREVFDHVSRGFR